MEIYDVFISYRRSDGQAIAESLYKYLVQKGLRVFYDKEKLEIGAMFPEQLKNGIRVASTYVLIATKDVFNFRTKEDWVREEMECALEVFQQNSDDRKLIVLEVNEAFPCKEALPEKLEKISESHRIQVNLSTDAEFVETDSLLKSYKNIFEKATEINCRNLWNAAHRWLGESKKEGGRFANLNICKIILPNVEHTYDEIEIPIKVENGNKTLFEAIKETDGHMYLIGQGGIGKTTALVHIMNEVYAGDKTFEKNQQIPIFVDLSFAPDIDGALYKTEVGSFIRRSIYRQIRTDLKVKQVSNANVNELDELFTMSPDVAVAPITEVFMQKGPVPEYLLLLDGLNEVSTVEIAGKPVSWRVAEEIRFLMNECSNVRVILTSRSDETLISNDEITRLYLAGVENETIVSYLKEKEFTQERISDIINDNDLIETLRIPLFLTMYASLSKENDAVMQGEILREFFNERRNNLNLYTMAGRFEKINENVAGEVSARQSMRITAEMYSFMLDFVLPEIAWHMEKNEWFYLSVDRIEEILTQLFYTKKDEKIDGINIDLQICGKYGRKAFEKYMDSGNARMSIEKVAMKMREVLGEEDPYNFEIITDNILTCCTLVLGILQKSNHKYGFAHQHIRDYFAAIKNINTIRMSVYMNEVSERKELALECMKLVFYNEPVSFVVRKFMGESLGEHKNQPYYNEQEQVCYGVPKDVCDRNLLDRALNIYRNCFNGEVGYALYSLIKILSEVRKSLSGCNLSELDMERCQLNSVELGRFGMAANVSGSKINFENLFFRGLGEDKKMEYSPDGNLLLLYGNNDYIYLLDAKTGIYLKKILKQAWVVKFVDNKTILMITALCEYKISLWDLGTHTEINEVELEALENVYVRTSEDKKKLIINDDRNNFYIVSIPDLQIKYSRILRDVYEFSHASWFFSEKKDEIIGIYRWNDGITSDRNHPIEYKIEKYNWETKETMIHNLPLESQILAIADNRTDIMLAYCFDNDIILKRVNKESLSVDVVGKWKVENEQYETPMVASKRIKVISLKYSESGKYLAVNRQGTVYLYETQDYKEVKAFEKGNNETKNITYNEAKNQVAVYRESGEIEVYDLNQSRLALKLNGVETCFKSFKLSYDSTRMLTLSKLGILRLWDINQMSLLNEVKISKEMEMEFSVDGKFVFVYSKEKEEIIVFSVPELRKVFSFEGSNFILSPDGKYFSAEDGDDTCIFNIPKFNKVQKIDTSNKMFLENKFIVEYVFMEKDVLSEYIYYVVDIKSGEYVCELYRGTKAIVTMSFAANYISCGNADGEIYLFDANTYQLIKQYHPLFEEGCILTRIEIDRTGKYILEEGEKKESSKIYTSAIVRELESMKIVQDSKVKFQKTTLAIRNQKGFFIKDLDTSEILFERKSEFLFYLINYVLDYNEKFIIAFNRGKMYIDSFDDAKNKRQRQSPLEKPKYIVEEIDNLNVLGVDFRNLHLGKKVNSSYKEQLRLYGAIVE